MTNRAAGARPVSRQPAPGPALELANGGSELASHLGQRVLHTDRPTGYDGAAHDATPLEFLHALGEQPVRERRHGGGDLTEAQVRAVDEDTHDGARPAPADELDRLVVVRAARWPPGGTCAGGGPCRRAVGVCRLLAFLEPGHADYAARSVRASSTDPSTGTSPATFTIAVKRSSATY